jgi:hypothetical protein
MLELGKAGSQQAVANVLVEARLHNTDTQAFAIQIHVVGANCHDISFALCA